MVKDGGPAFPSLEVYEGYNRDMERYEVKSDVATGMSLRDYFAAHAPMAPVDWSDGQSALEIDAIRAYRWADAMLKARESR